jgi:hypothetical protein
MMAVVMRERRYTRETSQAEDERRRACTAVLTSGD